MATGIEASYKLNSARYQHYYRQIWKFYQRPSVKVSLALLLTVFTILIFAVFAIRPTLTTIAELIREIEDQEVVLEKMETKAAALAQARQVYTQQQPGIERLHVAVPDTIELQKLITYVEQTAATHQVVISQLSLRDLVYEPPIFEEDTLVEVPFSVSMEADYQTLYAFLTDILQLPRYIVLNSLSFADGRESASSLTGSQELSLQLTALYYVPGTGEGE